MTWSKRRFEWKKLINQSRTIPRSAKHMASHLCDFCVNRQTGQFFHSNDTLAAAMRVSTRTIQRNLKILVSLGWLREVKLRGKRRTYQLAFPNGIGGLAVGQPDKTGGFKPTNMARKHDTIVAPIYNQVSNNTSGNDQRTSISSIVINEREENCLNMWKTWISENTEYDGATVMPLLRTVGGYQFPSRYPRDTSEDLEFQKRYIVSFMALADEDPTR